MTKITKAAQTSTEPWSFWEALPGHLIDKYEGATLTEELLQEAAASLHAKLRAEQPASQEPCSGPLCGLPEFGEHHPLCKRHLRAALQDKAGEGERYPSDWFALAMGAAASIEDAANCLRDEDAKRSAEGAAKYVRDKCNALWGSAHPAPVVPDRDVLTVNLLRHTSLTKTQARALIAHWLDGVVPDAALFKKADAVVPAGFALVPVEPTEAMIQAGIDEMPHFTDEPGPVWSAMIAASQQKGGSAG